MRARLLALALVLAGCASPDEDAPATADPPLLVAVALEDCAILEALVRIDRAAAAAHVPPGFTLAPPEPDGSMLAVLGAAECATGGSRGFFGFGVVAKDAAVENETVDRHFWLVEHHVGEGEPYGDAVAPLVRDPSLARIDATASATAAGFTIETDGWTHVARSTPGNARDSLAGMFGGTFREWFAADGGYGYLEASFAPGDASGALPVLVEPGAGSPAHALMGGARPSAMVALQGAGYADARVGFVPFH